MNGEFESWRLLQSEVEKCRQVEDHLDFFNTLAGEFVRLTGLRLNTPSPDGGRVDPETASFCESMLSCCERVDKIVFCFKCDDFVVEGASRFRSLWQAIESLARMSNATENPRPVTVDRHGRLIESTGDPIVMPGLDPDSIRRGLDDFKTGAFRPLRDIVAAPVCR